MKKLKKKGMYVISLLSEDIKVTEDILVKYSLVKGKEIDSTLISEIKKEETKEELFLKALNYISYQSRSVKEVRDYLIKHEATSANTNSIIKELTSLGYLNDKQMSSYILDSMVNNLKGPKKYEEKLFTKGIKDYVIYDSLIEDEVLDKAILKHKDSYTKYPKKKQIEKLANKLISDGFSSSKVFSKVSKLEYSDNAIETIDKDIEKLKKKYSKYSGFELKRKIVSSLLQRGYEYTLISKKLNIELDG